MKSYLGLIVNNNDRGIAFLCGSYITTFEELRNSIVNSELNEEKMRCIKFGRLGAVLDLFFAYFELCGKKNENNHHVC